jgi:flagellar M-ring protein FliF
LPETEPVVAQLDQMTRFVQGLTVRQRVLLAVGTVLVGATLAVFVWLVGKPKYATLYSGLRPSDAQAMGSRLAAKNIPYELSPDASTISVPSDKLDSSRLETAAQGLPKNARLGFELFDTPNWAGSDFSEQVNYQRALEGELERTLLTLSEVEAVRVHLVMPKDSLFTEQEKPGKAAVIVKVKGGRLSEQAQAAIPQLVASAVDKLRPENVTVVDADSSAPLLHPRGVGAVAMDFDQELAKTLIQTLTPVVGEEHVRASVHVEYDLSSSEDTQEIYDPKAAVATSQQKSEEIMGGASPAGIPGTASNIPGAANPAAGATTQDNQSSRSESATYAVSKSVRHTVQPAGRIRRITAAVLVDDAVVSSTDKKASTRQKRTPEELQEIEKLARAAIGVDPTRGDILAVENLSFQELPLDKPEAPSRLERSRKLLHDWSGALRYIGIGLLFAIVYMLILRPVKKQAIEAFRQLPARVVQLSRPLIEDAEPAVASDPKQAALQQGTKRAATLKKQLMEKVKTEPEAASRLVQSWMRQGEAAE